MYVRFQQSSLQAPTCKKKRLGVLEKLCHALFPMDLLLLIWGFEMSRKAEYSDRTLFASMILEESASKSLDPFYGEFQIVSQSNSAGRPCVRRSR